MEGYDDGTSAVAVEGTAPMEVDRLNLDSKVGELPEWINFLAALDAQSLDHESVFLSWCDNRFRPLRELRHRLRHERQLFALEVINAELANVAGAFAALAEEAITTVEDLLVCYLALHDLHFAMTSLVTCLRTQAKALLGMNEALDDRGNVTAPGVPGLAVLAIAQVLENAIGVLALLNQRAQTYVDEGWPGSTASPERDALLLRAWAVRDRVHFGAAAAPLPATDTELAAPAVVASSAGPAAPRDQDPTVPDPRRRECARLHTLITSARAALTDVRHHAQGLINIVSDYHRVGDPDVLIVTEYTGRLSLLADDTNAKYATLRNAVDSVAEAEWADLSCGVERAIFDECDAYAHLPLEGVVDGTNLPGACERWAVLAQLNSTRLQLSQSLRSASRGLAHLDWANRSYPLAFRQLEDGRSTLGGQPLPTYDYRTFARSKSYLDSTQDVQRLLWQLHDASNVVRGHGIEVLAAAGHIVRHSATQRIPIGEFMVPFRTEVRAILKTVAQSRQDLLGLTSETAGSKPTREQFQAFLRAHHEKTSGHAIELAQAVTSCLEAPTSPDPSAAELADVLAKHAGAMLNALRPRFMGVSSAPYAEAEQRLIDWRDSVFVVAGEPTAPRQLFAAGVSRTQRVVRLLRRARGPQGPPAT